MASSRFSKKVFISPSHLPTLMLVTGYVVYWIELYFLKRGAAHTTSLATLCFVLGGILSFFYSKSYIFTAIRELKQRISEQDWQVKSILCFGAILTLAILLCAWKASLLPPHLIQESDALNYHITMPRQHLILNSFQHLPWATADLYFLPIDFALSPFWLATKLPNKFPQFLFLIGFISIAAKLTSTISRDNFISKCLIILAVVGSHNVGIQMGTAMLDVVVCYLLLAALDSFLEGNLWLCAVEFTFYFWSKSFIPIQIALIFLLMLLAYGIARKFGFKAMSWSTENAFDQEQKKTYKKSLKKVTIYFVFLSVFIGGPFMGKSLYYAQTPLFPFFPGIISSRSDIDRNSVSWKSLVENAQRAVATKDQYGSGRSPLQWIKHFWLIAVPEKGVNNRYDYPVGIIYLLCLGPFVTILVTSIKQKRFAILPLFVSVYWAVWWVGSHQTRFLFLPIALMVIIGVSQPKFCSKIFMLCVLLALGLVSASMFRAHRTDFGKSAKEVLRAKDQLLLEMSQTIQENQPVILEFFDAAFADFAVDVVNVESVFVIKRARSYQ